MSDKIKSTDIFDDKVFDKIKQDASAFKEVLTGLKGELTAILQQQRNFLQSVGQINTAEKITKTNAALQQSKSTRTSLNAVTQQLIRLQDEEVKGKIRFNEANKRQRKELKDLIDLEKEGIVTLEKLNAKNRQLRRERAELDLTTAKGKKRVQEINIELDKNNKLIRQNSDALKKQRLNVGNYTSALKGLGARLRSIAGAFGLVTGAAGLVAVFRKNIEIFRTFEQVQTDLASILQKTRKETEALSQAAKDLGATTFFTATEVSKLQVELAKLGFDTQQIVDSEEAILDLAAAFSIDLPRAAKIVASTLNGFQLDASESGRVADVLAKSFAKSALDIEKFEVAISKVAPIAAGLGVDIETTTAALGKLVSAGFDASTAGTQFRNILLKLSNPASELANTLGFTVSSSNDLIEAFQTLNEEQLSIAEAQGLIDVRSVALLKSLSDNSDAVQVLRRELENAQGTAKDIASNQLKTLNGSFRLLTSAYEGFILSLDDGSGAFSQLLKDITQVFTGLFNLLRITNDSREATDESNESIEKARESFAALEPRIQSVANSLFNLYQVFETVVKVAFRYGKTILAVVVAVKAFNLYTAISTSRMGKFIKSLFIGEGAMIAFDAATKKATFSMKALTTAMKKNVFGLIASALAGLLVYFSDWIIGLIASEDAMSDLNDEAREALKWGEEMTTRMKKLASASEVFQSALKRTNRSLLTFTNTELSSALDVARDAVAKLTRELEENTKLTKDGIWRPC
jgi:TP901 family phage tail tape measure protein